MFWNINKVQIQLEINHFIGNYYYFIVFLKQIIIELFRLIKKVTLLSSSLVTEFANSHLKIF